MQYMYSSLHIDEEILVLSEQCGTFTLGGIGLEGQHSRSNSFTGIIYAIRERCVACLSYESQFLPEAASEADVQLRGLLADVLVEAAKRRSKNSSPGTHHSSVRLESLAIHEGLFFCRYQDLLSQKCSPPQDCKHCFWASGKIYIYSV